MHVYAPVYQCDKPELFQCSVPKTEKDRRESLKGIVVCAMTISKIADKFFFAAPNSRYLRAHFIGSSGSIMWSSNKDPFDAESDENSGNLLLKYAKDAQKMNFKRKSIHFESKEWFLVLEKLKEFDELFYLKSGRTIPIVIVAVVFVVVFLLFHSIIRRHKHETEELELKKKLVSYQHELHRSAYRQFLECISHDMRTPLQSATSALSLVSKAKGPILDHDTTQLLNVVDNSCSFVEMIMSNLMDFDKIQRNQLDIIEEVTDLTKCIKDLMFMMQFTTDNCRGDVLLIEEIDHLPLLNCDRSRVLRIVMNLVSNSIKFTQRGRVVLKVLKNGLVKDHTKLGSQSNTGRPRILHSSSSIHDETHANFSNSRFSVASLSIAKSINDYASIMWANRRNSLPNSLPVDVIQSSQRQSRTKGDQCYQEIILVKFSVEDTGCGMTQEEIKRFIEPYTHTSDERGGSGLGLYITHSFVEAFGGTLEIESEVGVGTKIEFVLRFVKASDKQIEEYLLNQEKFAKTTQIDISSQYSSLVESAVQTKNESTNKLVHNHQDGEISSGIDVIDCIPDADPNDLLFGVRVLLVEDNHINLRLGIRILQVSLVV